MPPLRIDILTLFPDLFAPDNPASVLGASIPSRARKAGLVEWHAANVRDYTDDPYQKVDDRPFGGGPGMVMLCQPLWDAVQDVESRDPRPSTRILLTPQGAPLTQAMVEDLAGRERLLLISGHYEGIDERVVTALDPIEVSLGDFVLSGGELASLVLMDAVIRLLPGALGHEDSAAEDSFSFAPALERRRKRAPEEVDRFEGARLLDCPHYTRPRVWMGMEVPDVLLSGDHGAVDRWRLAQRLERTRQRRPDLLTDDKPDGPTSASID